VSRLLLSGVLAVALLVGAAPGGVATAAQASWCRPVTLPVTLPVSLGGSSGPVSGTLCSPPAARVLQILIHGFSYNSSYWDVPYEPGTYSYVRRATDAGYATLAVDRLGDGQSWHPPSVSVDLQSNVDAIHQVVRAVRAGAVGTSYARIVLVGHSYGSVTALGVAGQYHDVDAVVASGWASSADYAYAGVALFPFLRPAVLEPRFAGSGLDPGYVAVEQDRRAVFLNPDHTDPHLVALNAVTLADTGTLAELATLGLNSAGNMTGIGSLPAVRVPVLVINGQRDPFFCGLLAGDCRSSAALAASERAFFGSAATVEGVVVPQAGHDLNLDLSAPGAYGAMLDFVARHAG